LSDIQELSGVDQTIARFVADLHGADWEKLATQYWLASLFLSYFKLYRLEQEDSLCRRAWIHLLRIRYTSLMTLHSLGHSDGRGSESYKKKDIEKFIPEALREWRTFIQDPRNHFLFREAYGLSSPEEEMERIVYNCQYEQREILYQFFLQDSSGKNVLSRIFIADWFLNDRYDWIDAFRLWSHCHHNTPVAIMIALLFLLIGVCAYFAGSLPYFGWILWGLAISLALGSEAFVQLMVPRLWAAVAVGYLPLMLTQEIWKLSTKISPYERAFYWLVSVTVSIFYLRWEIGNRLRATPNLGRKVSFQRAVILTLIGGVASFMIGFFLLDVVGGHFVEIYLKESVVLKAPLPFEEWKIPGVCGTVYPTLLFTFSPIALLLGVILQIFWQEKAVTAPV
jgi:hypothetical protein